MTNLNSERIKEVISLNQDQTKELNCGSLWDEYIQKLVTALGDSEDEIIDFISKTDKNTQLEVSAVAEELYDKFPTDKMDNFLKETYPNIWYDPETKRG